jgi:hypothetical protein
MENNFLEFPNLGVLETSLPKSLLNKIKKECSVLKNKTLHTTGLTSNGVAKHYYLKESCDELFDFLKEKISIYESRYKYIKSFNVLKKDTELCFGKPWFNIQKKGEFIPNHTHDGVFSYSTWIQVPYKLEEELKNQEEKFNSCFQFSYSDILGTIKTNKIFIDNSYEGKLILFPSGLQHCVYPFFKSNGKRISVSGNILFYN